MELHDQRVPYSVWCCWAHQHDLIISDQCLRYGCRQRAVRGGRCREHLDYEDTAMAVRDQILMALCPNNAEGIPEPLPSGLSFTELCQRVPVNRTTVARCLTSLREEHLIIRTGEPTTRDGRWYATGAPEPSEVGAARTALAAVLLVLKASAEPQRSPVSVLAKRVAEASAERETVILELNAALDERTRQRDDALEQVGAVESQMASLAAAKAEIEGGYRTGYRDGHRDGVASRSAG